MKKSTDPADYLGVFKSITDIPELYKLDNYASEYQERDVWQEHIDAGVTDHLTSDRKQRELEYVEEMWKSHADEESFHHAFPTPENVDSWFCKLRESRSPHTCYVTYFTRLNGFFKWLQWHTEYPHLYNPLWMAANNYEMTREIWDYKIKMSR